MIWKLTTGVEKMAKKAKHHSTSKLELESPDQGLMSPLDLQIAYQSPKSEMDLLPFLDLVLIGFLFFMLSSRLVYAPGVVVDLPKARDEVIQSTLVTDVLTVSKRGENLLFFYRGAIYDYEGLENFAKSIDLRESNPNSIILIKMDKNLPIQMQADLIAITQEMGYGRVQIAVEPEG